MQCLFGLPIYLLNLRFHSRTVREVINSERRQSQYWALLSVWHHPTYLMYVSSPFTLSPISKVGPKMTLHFTEQEMVSERRGQLLETTQLVKAALRSDGRASPPLLACSLSVFANQQGQLGRVAVSSPSSDLSQTESAVHPRTPVSCIRIKV